MTIFSYMYVLWVQKVGKTTKRNGKKESESKVLAILLKQIALQKSFINMTKAKQNVDTIKYIHMNLKSHIGQKKIDKRLSKSLGFF